MPCVSFSAQELEGPGAPLLARADARRVLHEQLGLDLMTPGHGPDGFRGPRAELTVEVRLSGTGPETGIPASSKGSTSQYSSCARNGMFFFVPCALFAFRRVF